MGILGIILSGMIAGLVGAVVMNLFLRWISTSFDEPVNMVKALGSYFTGKLENALPVGTAIHLVAGAVFGLVYAYLLNLMSALVLPVSLFCGFGFGFVHGLVTSYVLMFYMSERHPVPRYRDATFSIGILHLLAHVVYGGTVGIFAAALAMVFA